MRRPEMLTVEELLNYYTMVYYRRVEADPSILQDVDRQIVLVEELEAMYIKLLGVRDLDVEKSGGWFRENMDFLTRCYTKKRKAQEEAEAKAAFFNKKFL